MHTRGKAESSMNSTVFRRIVMLAAVGLSAGACQEPVAAVEESADPALVEPVRAAARPVTGAASDYEPLLALTATARVTLLGEGTHGTHEFYRERGRITRELVTQQGYTAVMVE